MSANELAIPFARAGNVLAAAIVLPVIAIMVVGLRFYLRVTTTAKLGADDWATLAALFPVCGIGICLIYGVAKGAIGYDSPPYPVPMDPPVLEELYETTPAQKLVFTMDWIIWLLLIPANGLIKLSALFLYRRLFVINKDTVFDIVTKIVIVVCLLWTIGFWLAQIFGCGRNFKAPFGALVQVASCNTNMRLDALMISDLITDILVWLLPMPVVWRLNMSLAKRLSVTGILLLAAVSLSAAIVRIIVQEEISNGGYAAHTDVNLTLTILLYWSMIESGLALIAACLPTLQFLVLLSAIKSGVDTARRLLTTTQPSLKSTPSQPYFKSQTPEHSQRSLNYESYELSKNTGKVSDVGSGRDLLRV